MSTKAKTENTKEKAKQQAQSIGRKAKGFFTDRRVLSFAAGVATGVGATVAKSYLEN